MFTSIGGNLHVDVHLQQILYISNHYRTQKTVFDAHLCFFILVQ